MSISNVRAAPPTDRSAPHTAPQGEPSTDQQKTTSTANVSHTLPRGLPSAPRTEVTETECPSLDTPVTALRSLLEDDGIPSSSSYHTLFPSPSITDGGSVSSSALIGRSNSMLTTVYYTARTNIPSRSSTIHSTTGNRTSINVSERIGVTSNQAYSNNNDGGDNDFLTDLTVRATSMGVELGLLSDDQEEQEETGDHDSLSAYELTHLPPYLPEVQPYLGFGRSLRDTVLYRQNSRVFPPEDRLQERMEDQLVRWGAPLSLFHVEEILNGKHAFQKDDMPVLEVIPRPKDTDQQGSSSSEALSSSSGTTILTTSTLSAISRSPFIVEPADRAPTRCNLTPVSNFVENNSGTATALGVIYEMDLSSIQESPPYLVDSTSPSITTSMRLQLNRSYSHLNTPTGELANDNIIDPPTAVAMPVSMEEVRQMVKNPPPLQTTITAHQLRLRRLSRESLTHYGDGDDIAFWQAVCEVWGLCCDDLRACFSCDWLFPGSDYGVEVEEDAGEDNADMRFPPRREHSI